MFFGSVRNLSWYWSAPQATSADPKSCESSLIPLASTLLTAASTFAVPKAHSSARNPLRESCAALLFL